MSDCMLFKEKGLSAKEKEIFFDIMKAKTVWRKLITKIINLWGGSVYLCDTCFYSYRHCSYHHPEYPNATKCTNYKARY